MQYPSDRIDPQNQPADILKVSQDGYIRMTSATFAKIPLVHFLSGLDDHPVCGIVVDDTEASISGYTEWLSTSVPAITIGWDWCLDLATGTPRYLRHGWPRANIMLIDTDNSQDLGEEMTMAKITSRIDQTSWENDVSECIALRYS